MSNLRDLVGLRELHVFSGKSSDLVNLEGLVNLRVLKLECYELSRFRLSRLVNLEGLMVKGCNLVFSDVGLVNLINLNVQCCLMTHENLVAIGKCERLESLNMYQCKFEDGGSCIGGGNSNSNSNNNNANRGEFRSLRELALVRCSIPIYSYLKKCDVGKIERLVLRNMEGEFYPEGVGIFSGLKKLEIYGCRLNGTTVDNELFRLKKLEELIVTTFYSMPMWKMFILEAIIKKVNISKIRCEYYEYE